MRPDVDLSSVENVQQVRAVWTGEVGVALRV